MRTKLFFLLLVVFLNTHINAQCWQSISEGNGHTVAIKKDGTLWAWGSSRLGDGTVIFKNIPTQIGTASNWQSIAAGREHTIALKLDGTLWSWGNNSMGQLGNGTFIDNYTPTQFGSATNWKSIAAGGHSSFAIKADGTLWAWGNNEFPGMLGDGTWINKNTPIQIGTDTNWQSVDSGYSHTVAIKKDGTLWAWGDNYNGQCGDGTTISISTPKQIGIESNWKSVIGGGGHTVAIKTNGTLWSWGGNSVGQLGDGTIIDKAIPTQIGLGTNWQSIAVGVNYNVAIKIDKTLWTWGQNTEGQLGDNTIVNKKSPIQVGIDTNWGESLAAGNGATFGIKSDGTLWAWGSNYTQQLGDGTTFNKYTPTLISCTSLGLEKIPVNNDSFSIYPNPVNDILHIQNTTNKVIDGIVITDLSGKKVLEQKGDNKQMNVQQLQQGMYLLQVFSEGKSSQSKFIKQ